MERFSNFSFITSERTRRKKIAPLKIIVFRDSGVVHFCFEQRGGKNTKKREKQSVARWGEKKNKTNDETRKKRRMEIAMEHCSISNKFVLRNIRVPEGFREMTDPLDFSPKSFISRGT